MDAEPRLGQEVNIVLQPIRNAKIPHRRGNQAPIKRQELIGPFLEVLPCGGLRGINCVAGEQVIAAVYNIMIERR